MKPDFNSVPEDFRNARYGAARVLKIQRKLAALREAVRREGTPEIQEAWDAMEPYFQLYAQPPGQLLPNPKEGVPYV